MILVLVVAAVLMALPTPRPDRLTPTGREPGPTKPGARGRPGKLRPSQAHAAAVLLVSLAVLLWTGVISAAGITLAAGWGLGAMIARFPPTARNPDVVLSPTDARAVPQVLVLFAALLRSGAPTQIALATVGEVSDGVIGRAFRRAGQELALGAPLGVVARSLGGAVGQDRIGSILARSMDSGAASAQELEQLAQECRRAYLAMAQEQAKRAGVQMVLPLGLCLLPAFVALGIVPIVAALLGDVAW